MDKGLSVQDIERYARQMVLPEMGREGQSRLSRGSVLCIGAGGLGSPALLYLAAAGIGRIGIIDHDKVEVSNLQRQVIFRESDEGRAKADAAKEALLALNSSIQIEIYQERFTAQNAEALFKSYDVILDGTDNFTAKFLINDAAVKFSKPWVYASILGFEAQVSTFYARKGPCYRCLFPHPPTGHVPNCAEAGVIGAIAGMAGSIEALEVIKLILGEEWCAAKGLEPLIGQLLLIDARSMTMRKISLEKDPDCPVCSKAPDEIMFEKQPEHEVREVNVYDLEKLFRHVVLIDVREAEELEAGILPDARHMPLSEVLKGRARDLAAPDQGVVLYCQSGVRSEAAARAMMEQGFIDVSHLKDGYQAWLREKG